MARQKQSTAKWLAWISLPAFLDWSSNVRSLVLNGMFFAALIILVPVVVAQFQRDQVIIEPVSVPDGLSEQGFTPEVVASRLWDGLQDVKLQARTSKESIDALPDARRVEFSFPDSGLSVESLIFHVRRLFGAYETRIAGEIVCDSANCTRDSQRLRLRVIRDNVVLIDLPVMGTTAERDYFRQAAAGVMSTLDPFVAIAATSGIEPVKATILARRLIRSHHPDSKWAHNLVGLIRINAGDYDSAIKEFREALALDGKFVPALSNLGNSLRAQGKLDDARQQFAVIEKIEPENVLAKEGLADIALAEGRHDAALTLLRQAAESAPLDPRYLAKAGTIQLQRGNEAEGVKLLRSALEIDPGYLPAFAQLAAIHLAKNQYVEAEKLYRDAADYTPDDAAAQADHGRLLAIVHKWEESAQRYRRAADLQPDKPEYWVGRAQALQALDRHAEALEVLTAAQNLHPASAEIFFAMGDSYRSLGKNAEAVSAYKKFLELDKSTSYMRLIAESYIKVLSG